MTTTIATSVTYRGIGKADYHHVNRYDYDLFGTVQRSDGKYIKTRLNLMNSSPTGFAWGYGGSGPSQLSLALLADALEDTMPKYETYVDFTGRTRKWSPVISLAMEFYNDFKWDVIANIADPSQGWELSQQYILDWVRDMRVTYRLQGEHIFRRGPKGEVWLPPTQEEIDRPFDYVETEGKETYN